MNSFDENRRKFERIDRSLVTYYRKLQNTPDDDLERAGLTKNISEGGILLELDDEYMIGDILALEIRLNDTGRPLFANGRIVRKLSNMFGISFERINEEDRLKFRKYIESRQEGNSK